jgi:hypothetical protein
MKKTTILAGAAALALALGGAGAAVAQAKAPARPLEGHTAKTHAKKAAKKPAKKKKKKKVPAKKPAVKKPAVVTPPVTGGYGATTPTAGDGTGPPNVLDAIEIDAGESSLPDLGLVTDVVQGLLGQPLG